MTPAIYEDVNERDQDREPTEPKRDEAWEIAGRWINHDPICGEHPSPCMCSFQAFRAECAEEIRAHAQQAADAALGKAVNVVVAAMPDRLPRALSIAAEILKLRSLKGGK